jgi:hypothetical protein
MSFCIKVTEYDPDIHEIVSGPNNNCLDCLPIISEIFHEFIEIEIPKKSMVNEEPDLFTIMIKDPQLMTRYEILIKLKNDQSDCFYSPSDEQCPQGFVYAGSADCEQDLCDNICCRIEDSDYDVFICGNILQGEVSYNHPWSFYLNPDTISFKYRNQIEGKIISSIDDLEEYENNSEVCFYFQAKSRIMELKGFEYCQPPLLWEANRIFDEENNTHIQMGTCVGFCEDREENYCFDNFNANINQKTENLLSQLDQEMSSLDDNQFEEYLQDNISNIEQIFSISELEDFPSEEELLELLIVEEEDSFSSSSSEPSTEPKYFDITFSSSTNPYLVELDYGTNNIKVNLSEDVYISFVVHENSVLSSFYLLLWITDENAPENMEWQTEISLQTGSVWDNEFVETFEFGSSIPFPQYAPLLKGTYTLKISSYQKQKNLFEDDETDHELSLVLSMILEQNNV